MAYPSSLDNLPTSRNPTDLVGPDSLAEADAINRMQTAMGLNPQGTYVDVTSRLNALETLAFNFQTGTTYTLVLSDATDVVSMTNSAANALKVPTDASVPFLVGTQISIRQGGSGTTTVSAVTPATTIVRSRGSAFNLAGQYAWATLIKVAVNTWELTGDIA